MLYQYLPIKLVGGRIIIPKPLCQFFSIVSEAIIDANNTIDVNAHYIYMTVKTRYVTPDRPGNRPGWHADGYASNGDLNYVWYNHGSNAWYCDGCKLQIYDPWAIRQWKIDFPYVDYPMFETREDMNCRASIKSL